MKANGIKCLFVIFLLVSTMQAEEHHNVEFVRYHFPDFIEINNMGVMGDYLICSWWGQYWTFDISNPDVPILEKYYDHPNGYREEDVYDLPYIYVVDDTDGWSAVSMLNYTDPLHPFHGPNLIWDIYDAKMDRSSDILFLLGGALFVDYLTAYSINDNDRNRVITRININAWDYGINCGEQYSLIATRLGDIYRTYVIDNSDRDNIHVIDTLDGASWVKYDVYENWGINPGNNSLIANSFIPDDDNQFQQREVHLETRPLGARVSGNWWIAGCANIISVIDASDMDNLYIVENYDTPFYNYKVIVNDDYLMIAGSNSLENGGNGHGFQVYDISDLPDIELASEHKGEWTQNFILGIADSIMWVAARYGSIGRHAVTAYGLTEGYAWVFKDSVFTTGYQSLYSHGYAFTFDAYGASTKVSCLGIDDQYQITCLDTVLCSSEPYNILADDSTLLINTSTGCHLYDFTDPTNITYLSTIGYDRFGAVDMDKKLVLLRRNYNLRIYDITSRREPVLIHNANYGVWDVKLFGNTAFLDNNSVLSCLDFTNPLEPDTIFIWDHTDFPTTSIIKNDSLWIHCSIYDRDPYMSRINVFAINSNKEIFHVAWFDIAEPISRIAAYNDRIFASTYYLTYEYRLIQPFFVDDPQENIVPVTSDFLTAYPNPSNNAFKLHYTITSPSIVDIKIHNTEGRAIRSIHIPHAEAGSHTLDVDCADLASGIYFIRLHTDKTSLVHKVTLIR